MAYELKEYLKAINDIKSKEDLMKSDENLD